jgi:DNA-binding GntR family transcriptional regulator
MKYSRLSNYQQVIEEHNKIIHAVIERDLEKALFYLEENVI